MKKAIVTLCLIIACVLPVLSAYADLIAPYAAADNTLTATLSLNGATGTGGAIAKYLPGHSAETTIYVQMLQNGGWSTIATASGGAKVGVAFSASTGVTYRVYAVSTITNTTTGENELLACYSGVKTN